jgi:hypothetical protein
MELKQRIDSVQSTSAVKRKRSCAGGEMHCSGAPTGAGGDPRHSANLRKGGVLGLHSPQLSGEDGSSDEGGDDYEDALEAALEAAACGDLEFSSEDEWQSSASEDMDVNGSRSACEVAEDSCANLGLKAEGGDVAPKGETGHKNTRACHQKGQGHLARAAGKREAGDDNAAPDSFSQVQCPCRTHFQYGFLFRTSMRHK